MMRFFTLFSSIFLFSFLLTFAQNSGQEIFLKNKIILKIKPSFKDVCNNKSITNSELNHFFSEIGVIRLEKKFPNIESPKSTFNKYGEKNVDISTIYEIQFKNNISLYKIISFLNSLDIVEYAQPIYIDKVLSYVPNDPQNVNQYYLNNIRAYDAWGLSGGKGDSSIVIGIVDTGVDIVHEDLVGNIFYNANDTLDGIDNDNDGYIDNYRGWDIANNDNNPMTEQNTAIGIDTRQHGTYVAGCAAARTDNGKGISGPGFYTKFLPIKVLNSDGYITTGYEGLLYAAEHGCKIINCSWGGSFGHPYGQDIINYATYNKNALVIAAAGNGNDEHVLYPAAYENVIAVAGTNSADNKWNNSTYGVEVDVSTPGQNILFTKDDNGYKYGWGTSFASPITAGAAAIISSIFPQYSALQIAERLRITCDNIDTVSGNEVYIGKLGKGRINLFTAISTNESFFSIRFSEINYQSVSGTLTAGDTVYMSGIFKNYLDSAQNVLVTLTTENENIQILQSTFSIGSLGNLDTISNIEEPFVFVINSETDFESIAVFKLMFESDNQNDYQYLKVNISPSYLDIYPNKISTTVCSNGRIGYNSYIPLTGVGLQYKNEVALFEGGLMVGNSNSKVACSVRDSNDYVPIIIADTIYEENIDNGYATTFESLSSDHSDHFDFKQKIYTWNDSIRDNFIISEYLITNNNLENIENLYVSFFTDWDVVVSYTNKTNYNDDLNLGYTYNTGNDSLYAGIKILTHTSVNHYGIDNVDGGNGGIDISDGFSIEEQFFSMTNNRHNAGSNSSTGTDVVEIISIGPISLNAGDSVTIGFAFIVAENLYKLVNSANEAQYAYDYLHTNIHNITHNQKTTAIPNPTNASLTITSDEIIETYEIFDLSGTLVKKGLNIRLNAKIIDVSNLKSGMYFIKIYTKNKIETIKFSKIE